MDSKIKTTFDDLFKIQDNKFCFECADPALDWVSVNNGIFLCESCAAVHRKFGINVSSIRSISNDPWSDLHLTMMVNGGNTKLRNFFDKYYIPKDGPIDFKYRTKGAYHYREILRNLSEGKILPEPIDPDQALEIERDIDPHAVPDYEIASHAKPIQGKGLEKMYSFMEKTFDQTVQKTKETANVVNEKLKDPNFKEGVKQGVIEVGTTIVQETKNVTSLINEKIHDPNLKQNVKDVGEKIATSAKMGFLGAVSFWKKISGQNVEPAPVQFDEDKLETVYSTEAPTNEISNLSISDKEEPKQSEVSKQNEMKEEPKQSEVKNHTENDIKTL